MIKWMCSTLWFLFYTHVAQVNVHKYTACINACTSRELHYKKVWYHKQQRNTVSQLWLKQLQPWQSTHSHFDDCWNEILSRALTRDTNCCKINKTYHRKLTHKSSTNFLLPIFGLACFFNEQKRASCTWAEVKVSLHYMENLLPYFCFTVSKSCGQYLLVSPLSFKWSEVEANAADYWYVREQYY